MQKQTPQSTNEQFTGINESTYLMWLTLPLSSIQKRQSTFKEPVKNEGNSGSCERMNEMSERHEWKKEPNNPPNEALPALTKELT